MDRGWAIATADDAGHRNDDNIGQQVFTVARVSRITQRFKISADGTNLDQLGHSTHPSSGESGQMFDSTPRIQSGSRMRQSTYLAYLCALAVISMGGVLGGGTTAGPQLGKLFRF